MDFFCKKCTFQFGKKYVFDLHLSLVHGEKMEVKIEPKTCEENFQDPQPSEQDFSLAHEVKIEQKICEENFQDPQISEQYFSAANEVRIEPKICGENFQQPQTSEQLIYPLDQLKPNT